MSIRPTHVNVELSQTRPELAEQEFIGPEASHDVYGLSHALVRDMIKPGLSYRYRFTALLCNRYLLQGGSVCSAD